MLTVKSQTYPAGLWVQPVWPGLVEARQTWLTLQVGCLRACARRVRRLRFRAGAARSRQGPLAGGWSIATVVLWASFRAGCLQLESPRSRAGPPRGRNHAPGVAGRPEAEAPPDRRRARPAL